MVGAVALQNVIGHVFFHVFFPFWTLFSRNLLHPSKLLSTSSSASPLWFRCGLSFPLPFTQCSHQSLNVAWFKLCLSTSPCEDRVFSAFGSTSSSARSCAWSSVLRRKINSNSDHKSTPWYQGTTAFIRRAVRWQSNELRSWGADHRLPSLIIDHRLSFIIYHLPFS